MFHLSTRGNGSKLFRIMRLRVDGQKFPIVFLMTMAHKVFKGDAKTAARLHVGLDAARRCKDAWELGMMRDAIRAKTRRQPPRGYEEILGRYYESID